MAEEHRLVLTLVPKFDTDAAQSAFQGTINVPGGQAGPNQAQNAGDGGQNTGFSSQSGQAQTTTTYSRFSPNPQTTSQAGSDAISDLNNASWMSRVLGRLIPKTRKEASGAEISPEEEARERRKDEFKKQALMTGLSAASSLLTSMTKNVLGFVEDIYKQLVKSSPLLQAVESMFNLAVQLFFMPLGNKLGEVLIPATIDLLDAVIGLWDTFEGKTLGDAVTFGVEQGVKVFSEYVYDIGEELSDQGGIIGTIGRIMEKVGSWMEGNLARFIDGILRLAEWLLTNLPEVLSMIIGLQTAQLGATIGGASLFGNITGPWAALAGAGIGFGVGFGATELAYTALDLPRFAEGGWIPATPGGRLAIVGEGGEDEYIIPKSKMGSMGSIQIINNFYGYNEQELVEKVNDTVDTAISRSRITGAI